MQSLSACILSKNSSFFIYSFILYLDLITSIGNEIIHDKTPATPPATISFVNWDEVESFIEYSLKFGYF